VGLLIFCRVILNIKCNIRLLDSFYTAYYIYKYFDTKLTLWLTVVCTLQTNLIRVILVVIDVTIGICAAAEGGGSSWASKMRYPVTYC